MASRSLVSTAFVCARCQHSLSRSLRAPVTLASNSTNQTPFAHRPPKSYFHTSRPRPSRRSDVDEDETWAENLQAPARRVNDGEALPETRASIEDVATNTPGNGDAFRSGDAKVPWYLQEQQQQQPDPNPFLERQRIPELPENAPPILEPLLQHVSVDLGLDYLSVLDLRSMDPPPALGANLVMLFGSARSEKHLNVSADRLCRWLRANYKLQPIADGLLGRNELKLKLKRRNRRARMMTAAGGAAPSDPDDGITTGWICVNVGTVEDGPNKELRVRPEEDSDFAGFESGIDGAKIVVQIMTESKRGEIDLEGLWTEALETSMRRKEGARRAREKELAAQQEVERPDALHDNIPGETERLSSDQSRSDTRGMRTGMHSQQVRSFHSYPPRRATGESTTTHEDQDAAVHKNIMDQPSSPDQWVPPESSGMLTSFDSEIPTNADGSGNIEQLRSQISHLKNMKPHLALWLLGKNQQDKSSTSFLKAFHQSMPIIPDAEHLFARLELHCYAVTLGHPGYTRDQLVKYLREMQAAAIFIPEETFLAAFETVLMAHNSVGVGVREPTKKEQMQGRSADVLDVAMRRVFRYAFEVLEHMESYGHDARSQRVFTILHDAIANPVFEPPHLAASQAAPGKAGSPPAKLGVQKHAQLRHRFRRALDMLYVAPPNDDELYLRMLQGYATASPPDWSSFWEFWQHLARLMRPRTPEMYTLMFNAVASSGHVAKCQETLLWQFPEMERESPVVECKGDVAGAVLECLIAAKAPRNAPPYTEMWDAAEKGL